MLSRWPTNPFGIVPRAPITTGTPLVLTFHSFLSSLARSWYFSIFSFSFRSTLASPGTATSIIWQAACCLSVATRSALLRSSYYYYYYYYYCCCFRKPSSIIVFENKREIRVAMEKKNSWNPGFSWKRRGNTGSRLMPLPPPFHSLIFELPWIRIPWKDKIILTVQP